MTTLTPDTAATHAALLLALLAYSGVHRLGRAVRISEPDLLRFLRSCRT